MKAHEVGGMKVLGMNARHYRQVALLLLLVLVLGELLPCAVTLAEGPDYLCIADSRGYVKLSVNSVNGRFRLDSVGGLPWRLEDDGKPLLSDSFTSFRVNAQDYVYGNAYGLNGSAGRLLQAPVVDGNSIVSRWQVQGVEVIQTLSLFDAEDSDELGNLLVSYRVNNSSAEVVQLGSRILLDTMLGESDSAPLALLGQGAFVTNEAEFAPSPSLWRVVDSSQVTRVTAIGQTPTGAVESDRMIVAHYAGISQSKWDYQPDGNVNFTEVTNRHGTADSAVALYWDPAVLGAGETRTYQTLYGLGNVRAQSAEADYALQLFAPKQLHLNEAQTGYTDGFFTVSLEIANGMSAPLPAVQATLDLGAARGVLKSAQGESLTKDIDFIMPGQIRTFTWRVEAIGTYLPRVARYRAAISIAGKAGQTVSGMLLVPPLAGNPPPLQVTGVTPDRVFMRESGRRVTLRGSGFNILMLPETDWTLKLIRQSDPSDVRTVPRDETHVQVAGDNSIVVSLQDGPLWGEALSPSMEAYTLELDALERGKFRQTIVFTNQNEYRTQSYGLLVVRQDGDSRYSLQGVKDETELGELKQQGMTSLLEIRGKISSKHGSLPGGYSGTYYEVEPGAVINSKVQYELDSELAAYFGKESQRMIAFASGGGVYLEGSGTLSIPSFPFYSGKFEVNLLAGKTYSLQPNQDQLPVAITWGDMDMLSSELTLISAFPVVVTGAEIGSDKVNFTGKLLLLLDAVMRERQQSGDETTLLNLINAGVEVRRAEYLVKDGVVQLQGLKAEGEIGLLNKVLPIQGLDFGAGARVLIDTIAGVYEIDAAIKFHVINFDGKIHLKLVNDLLLPDEISFKASSSVGIPLVLPKPLIFINGGGGGFSGLADTVAGRYNAVPPLKLWIEGSGSIAKVVSLSDAKFVISLREISYTAGMSAFHISVFDEISGHLLYDDNTGAFTAKTTVSLNLLSGFLTGSGSITFRHTPGANHGLFGPVWVGGTVSSYMKIPTFVPLVGGAELSGMTIQVSSSHLYGDMVVATVPVWVEYNWGSEGITVGADKPTWLGGQAPGASDPPVAGLALLAVDAGVPDTAEGQGQVMIGRNWQVLGTSENNAIPLGEDGITGPELSSSQLPSGMQATSMSVLASPESLVQSNANFTLHTVQLNDLDNGVIVLRFVGDVPGYESLSVDDITVSRPDGGPYPLQLDSFTDDSDNATANCLFQTLTAEESSTGMTERIITIGVPSPQHGAWQVHTRMSTTSVALINAQSGRKISDVSVTPEDASGHAYHASWQTSHLQGGENVTLLLCGAEKDDNGQLTDAGTVIAEGIPAAAGQYFGRLSDHLASGDYYLRAVLSGSDQFGETINYSSDVAAWPLTVTDRFQPQTPRGLQVSTIGDGYLRVLWDEQPGTDGYYVELLDQNGLPLDQVGAVETSADETEIILGGTFRAVPAEDSPNSGAMADPAGLIPGRTYKVAVTAYRGVQNQQAEDDENAPASISHYSEAAVSTGVYLPEPHPPVLQAVLRDSSGEQLLTEADATGTLYLSSTEQVRLQLQSDQPLASLVVTRFGSELVSDSNVAAGTWTDDLNLTSGEQRISILAVNAAGDTAQLHLRVNVDNVAPALQMEQPEVEGGQVKLRGRTEPGATVTIDAQPVALANDGSFAVTRSLAETLRAEYLLEATDRVGNSTTAHQQVMRAVEFQKVQLQPSGNDGALSIAIGQSQSFQLRGYDAQNNSYLIPTQLTEFEVLAGESLLQSREKGEWQALRGGQAVLSAAFRVSADYAFYDTLILEINDPNAPPADGLPPRVAQAIADQTVRSGETLVLDLGGVFTDPEGLPLALTADGEIGQLVGNAWRYTAVSEDIGSHLITLRADDQAGLHVSCSFLVTVLGRLPAEDWEPAGQSKTMISDYVRTSDDRRAEEALRQNQDLRLILIGDQASFSSGVLNAFSEAGRSFSLIGDGAALEFPPSWLAGVEGGSTVEIAARQLSSEEQAQRLAEARLEGSTGLFEIGGKIFDLSVLVHSGNGTEQPVEQFGEPVAVTIDLSDLELTAAEVAQLTGVRLQMDGTGNLVPVALGGEYDPITRTFTFYTDRFSLYTVMLEQQEKLVLSLTAGSNLVVVNGDTRVVDVAPQIVTGRTLVPLRFISEMMGADVAWVQETRTVIVQWASQRTELWIGKTDFAAGLDVPAQVQHGRTLVPLRYLSETLGIMVHWDSASKTVKLEK